MGFLWYYSLVSKKASSTSTVSPTSVNVTPEQVDHIAHLATIPTSAKERERLAHEFSDTLSVVAQLKSVDVSDVEPTHQVTGLENVLRNDEVRQDLCFSQAEALVNARRTHQGYFVVERILEDAGG